MTEEKKPEVEQPAREPARKPVFKDEKKKPEVELPNDVAEARAKMSFEEKLEQEVDNIEEGRPYVIFKKVLNPQTKFQKRNKPIEEPMVHYLDGCHGNAETVSNYLKKDGWELVSYGNIDPENPDIGERLKGVLDLIKMLERARGGKLGTSRKSR